MCTTIESKQTKMRIESAKGERNKVKNEKTAAAAEHHKAHSSYIFRTHSLYAMRMKWESLLTWLRVSEWTKDIFACSIYKIAKRSQWIVANEDDKWNWMPCKAPTIYFYSSFGHFHVILSSSYNVLYSNVCALFFLVPVFFFHLRSTSKHTHTQLLKCLLLKK